MQTRREFLVTAGLSLGGWFVGAELARWILRLARERKAPYLIEVRDPEHILYAHEVSEPLPGQEDRCRYEFSLDYPWGGGCDAASLTWKEWFELSDVDWKDRALVRQHLMDSDCYDYEPEDEDGPFVGPRLDDSIPEKLQKAYEEDIYIPTRGPTSKAWHYLDRLPLWDHAETGPNPLGSLEFIDGYCPCNDTFCVQTWSLETLGGLQQRLLELGQEVEIRLLKEADWMRRIRGE